MFRRSRTEAAKENAAAVADLAATLAADRRFRKQLIKATEHGARAKRRAASRIGLMAAVSQLARDEELRHELAEMTKQLQAARDRIRAHRSHRKRNTLLVVTGLGVAGAAASRLGGQQLQSIGRTARTIEAETTVDVPVSVAYNQWTQFEEFPQFLEGVEDVRQLDDTRLHWVANVGGRRAEWDAKILEQHPDRQISWVSEDGRTTRGTVTFEPLGESRTLVRLSMGYMSEGVTERLGSVAGMDARRVRGDLMRFKQLIESRGSASGAWRGEVSAGTTTT
jgi:uncharacterized membrane protein